MNIKKYYLIFIFATVAIIALLYGISSQWFARTFLDVPNVSVDIAHILCAVMCLYLGLGIFWLYAAFNDTYRNVAMEFAFVPIAFWVFKQPDKSCKS